MTYAKKDVVLTLNREAGFAIFYAKKDVVLTLNREAGFAIISVSEHFSFGKEEIMC